MPDERSSADRAMAADAQPGAWSRRPRPAVSETDRATSRVQLRRSLVLTAMTVVLPGSAQVAAGNRRIGLVALRIWGGLLLTGVLLLLVGLVSRPALLSIVLDTRPLTLARWLLSAAAIGWVLLLVDAWRLGMPQRMARQQRLFVTAVNGVLCFAVAGSMLFAANVAAAQSNLIGSVFAASEVSDETDGRYNVLLLGGDSGSDREGLRPDSLSVASIDAETGRTVVVGLPRNLENVPFTEGSVMDREFPDGFDCEDECYLNSVNTWAEEHADLFEGEDDPGMAATVDAVEAITGLEMSYYAMINMEGFAQLIDAVGGVEVDVKERTAIGGIGAPITGWIDAGVQTLDGHEALWYSRSRVKNSDFSRMGRQKCVMNAMLQQMSPQKVLLNVQGIAESGQSMLRTDIPAGELDRFADLALKARNQPMSTVSLVPPAIDTGDPDYPAVRQMISDAVAAAEGQSMEPSALEAAAPAVPGPEVPAEEAAADPAAANQSENLDETC